MFCAPLRETLSIIPVLFFFFIFSLGLLLLPQPTCAQYETPVTLKASHILKTNVQHGIYYSVKDAVRSDGMLNHYEVVSPFGIFSVSSTSSLHILLHEIEAIAAMKKVNTKEIPLSSLKKSDTKSVTDHRNMHKKPQETLEGKDDGVLGLFTKANQRLGQRENIDSEDNQLEQLVGIIKSKGALATKFGVSMYSSNQVLQNELNRLAKAHFGGLDPRLVTGFDTEIGELHLSAPSTACLFNEVINTTPAPELWLQNKNALLAMDMSEDTVQLFLHNPSFSPALFTIVVKALQSMKTVKNLELFLKICLGASTPDMAKIITETVVLTAGYHKNIMPIVKISPMARLAYSKTRDGRTVVILPLDNVLWTKKFDVLTTSLKQYDDGSTPKSKEIWLLGDISSKAMTELQQQGWVVNTQVKQRLLPSESRKKEIIEIKQTPKKILSS